MALAHKLDWDSEFFGYSIAQADIHTLDLDTRLELKDWCQVNQIDCLYFLAEPNDALTVRLLEQERAHLTDVRVTLTRDLTHDTDDLGFDYRIRHSRYEDISILRDLVTFDDSRFYYDRLQPKAAELFKVWIEKSCYGYADAVFVCELSGHIAGYVTVKGSQIVLMAAKIQRQGVASTLCRHALKYIQEQGHKQAAVVTQGRNVAAQAMYQRNGFVTTKTELYYHWWVR